MKNEPLKSARRRGLWKCGQGIRLAHSPTAQQNQKKRTYDVLPKPDNFIRYRQPLSALIDGSYSVRCCWSPRIAYFSGFFVMAGLDPAIHESTGSCNQGYDNVT
jgi:hypothetical protein